MASVDGDRKEANCAICNQISGLKCSNCVKVFYCSAVHQKQDWKHHKPNCHSFEVASNEKFGRHLLASRNIKAGEIILKESALIRGPSQITYPVCILCLQGLEESDIDNDQACERCGWPLCKQCKQKSNSKLLPHAECDFTIKRGDKISIQHHLVPHPTYQCITVLRCLLMKDTAPDKWEKMLRLESHCDLRRGSLQWHNDREGIAKFIGRYFKCPHRWEEEEVLKVAGIVQVNGHEVPLTDPAHVAIYDLASLVEHSCAPNLIKSFTSKGDLVLWAPNPIEKGDHLSICYSDALWGTANRQNHLHQTKMFQCDCSRCLDNTEFGTYFSAIKCNGDNCNGLLLPARANQWNGTWQCNICVKIVEQTYVQSILERATKDSNALNKSDENQCIKFLEEYSKWLPPNHFTMCDVELTLTQAIGSGGPISFQNVPEERLRMKISLCSKLLKLVNTLAASECRALGALHFELHAGLAEHGRRMLANRHNLFRTIMEESIASATEAVSYLQHEPIELCEGQICTQARANIESLKAILASPSAAGL